VEKQKWPSGAPQGLGKKILLGSTHALMSILSIRSKRHRKSHEGDRRAAGEILTNQLL
jgi:hypothetical protein